MSEQKVMDGVRFMREKLDDDEWPEYLDGLANRFEEILNLASGPGGPRYQVRVRRKPHGPWRPVAGGSDGEPGRRGDESAR